MGYVNLNDYRCDCGRLLFKGALLKCNLEIKCKKCGKINLFKNFFSDQNPTFFTLTINESGIITDACCDAEILLGYPRQEFISKQVADICPALRNDELQKMHDSLAVGATYRIKNNSFFVRDGATISYESYCVRRRKNGVSAGYHMFNVVANDK